MARKIYSMPESYLKIFLKGLSDFAIKDLVINLHIDKQSRKSAFRELRFWEGERKGLQWSQPVAFY